VTYLALDLGVASACAAVWSGSGLVSLARGDFPAEPSPRDWWAAVESAVGSLDADLVEVEGVGCAGDAETYVLLARDGEPLAVLSGPLAARLSGADLSRVGWVVHGRDFVASLLTGRLASDPTAASATGFFSPDGVLLGSAVEAAGVDPEWLPPQRGSTDVLGDLLLPAARRLGLRSRIPVVTGATSQMCAVEGIGALPVAPLVTYASSSVLLSVPVEPPVASVPAGVALRAGGRSYQMLEVVLPPDPVALAASVAALAPEAQIVYVTGPADASWRGLLAAAAGLPVVRRRSGEPGTLGLAMLTATGVGAHLDRDAADPVDAVDVPDPAAAQAFADARP
jgi:sugar (pentulose or hexulose) kinase